MTEKELAEMAGFSVESDLMRHEPNNFGPAVERAYEALRSLAENDIDITDIIPSI
ncbi:MAG TPA: hypothetical protein VK196_15815 [Magnetospirillum sp.]|nr:hypothetical protein [Magnetospirillum sp.]